MTAGARLALLLPGLAFLAVSFVLPLLWLLRMSLGHQDGGGFDVHTYAAVLGDPFYWRMAANTLLLGAIVAAIAVLLAFPVGLFLDRTTSGWRGVLICLAVAPLLTSTVVRTYGWMVILNDRGLVNGTLRALGLITRPLPLANNFTGAAIAMVEILMPYAILSVLSGLGRVQPAHEEAAALHGANRLRVFTRVTLPLSMPGILTALLLVFVLAISSFITPLLMGGGRVFVFGTEIYNEATVTLNWPLAATLAMLLVAFFAVAIFLYGRVAAGLRDAT